MQTSVKYAAIALLFVFTACNQRPDRGSGNAKSIPVILDTDTNNELDDQHALAYLILNDGIFDIKGITVNATKYGGNIDNHYDEAMRIVRLCGAEEYIKVYKGANGNFTDIEPTLDDTGFDGAEAVNFIIDQAKKYTGDKLTVIAVGKLTNLSLALKKEPSIARKIRLLWLGSNYPQPGEYNLENDIPALDYILHNDIEFEMAVCRYGDSTGTDAVRVTPEEIDSHMPGKGPHIPVPIQGRHGGEFNNFGDYSVNLFEHINLDGDPPSRALFDMAAVAIVKQPGWAERKIIPAPDIQSDSTWKENPDNGRKIAIREKFHKKAILEDFFNSFE